jgi:hypothetical protein
MDDGPGFQRPRGLVGKGSPNRNAGWNAESCSLQVRNNGGGARREMGESGRNHWDFMGFLIPDRRKSQRRACPEG